MVQNRTKVVPFRRKRTQKTNYKKRYYLLKGRKPRLVVRKSLQHMLLQIVNYEPTGDVVVVQAHSSELKNFGMDVINGNIPCAYLTGMLLAKKAKEKGVTTAVADLGLQVNQKQSRLFAAIKGAVDGGLDIPLGESAIPSQERLNGQHIAQNQTAKYTRYKNAKEYPALVEKVKATIQK